jgi:hypothetical protein
VTLHIRIVVFAIGRLCSAGSTQCVAMRHSAVAIGSLYIWVQLQSIHSLTVASISISVHA